MDFNYPESAELFRTEIRGWLATNLDDRYRASHGLRMERASPAHELAREWNRRLADAGYGAIAWPPQWGGRSAGVMEQVVFAEEMHRADAPSSLNPIGLSNIAPAIIQFGTPEQQQRFLPSMLRGDDIWCQGFSEPDAGSDLASLKASAVLDGDTWVINGQKTWNTFGHLANWCELLVRTDRNVPKHKGITCILVDMTLPGVEVRPLMTLTADNEFNEIFFDNVRVPVSSTLGPIHEGWRVAMTTLAYERGGVAKLHLGTRAKVAKLIELARSTPGRDGLASMAKDPVTRQHLAQCYLEGELLKLVSQRAISGELHGRPMGPEGSIAKLVWSETEQHVTDVASEVLGPDALFGPWARDRAYSRSFTIAGGTTQINKQIIAQRILGMPRDR